MGLLGLYSTGEKLSPSWRANQVSTRSLNTMSRRVPSPGQMDQGAHNSHSEARGFRRELRHVWSLSQLSRVLRLALCQRACNVGAATVPLGLQRKSLTGKKITPPHPRSSGYFAPMISTLRVITYGTIANAHATAAAAAS